MKIVIGFLYSPQIGASSRLHGTGSRWGWRPDI